MAKLKQRVGSSLHSKANKQNLYKVDWSRNNWGGKIGKNKKFETGDNLLRVAMLDEVIPNREDYFIRPNGQGPDYYLLYQGFHESVEYSDIKTFVKNKMVYVYNEFNEYGKH